MGYKEKKWPKMAKNLVCHAPYTRNHTSYDLHLWYSQTMEETATEKPGAITNMATLK